MKSTIEQVREFHDAFGVTNHDEPFINDEKINALRIKLNHEEAVIELYEALQAGNKEKVLDALCDAQYVLDGAFLQLGFWKVKDVAFSEVHRSNMTKLGNDGKPVVRKDGKVIKGPNYTPPNLKQYV